jgi:hypothetical protein
MKVFVGHDGKIRVRIGQENLGSESLGVWYGGSGAIRLRQFIDRNFGCYVLDPTVHRGTRDLPDFEFDRIKQHLPSAQFGNRFGGSSVDIRISLDDFAMLQASVTQLSTRLVRFGDALTVTFGDFSIWVAHLPGLSLFHLGDNSFLGFRKGTRSEGYEFSTLREDDMDVITSHLGSARLMKDQGRTLVDLGEDDVAKLVGMAEQWDSSVETVHRSKFLGG